VDLESTAAALQWRNQDFASVSGEHSCGGSVDVREKRVLDAPGEHRDSPDTLSSWLQMARRPRPEIDSAQGRRHAVEAAQRPGHQAPERPGLQRLPEPEGLGERDR
jgi:hypothetical protein